MIFGVITGHIHYRIKMLESKERSIKIKEVMELIENAKDKTDLFYIMQIWLREIEKVSKEIREKTSKLLVRGEKRLGG